VDCKRRRLAPPIFGCSRMAKSKLRVRPLTLAPLRVAGEEGGSALSDAEEDECLSLLVKEQMARMTDILIISGGGNHPRPHVHGVEPEWRSKFWASRVDDYSSVESEEEESSPLVNEATAARLTSGHFQQAVEELSSPSAGNITVCLS
jgi:hypothetical protein